MSFTGESVNDAIENWLRLSGALTEGERAVDGLENWLRGKSE